MIQNLVRRSTMGRGLLKATARAKIALSRGEARVHLGCGEQIFEGYINIDFPPSEHTLQKSSRADFYADIRELDFPEASLSEVRSHHVFEHFDRPTALALLVRWQRWLRPGGMLRIETPDFDRSARAILDPDLPFADKAVSMRHLFGSHEASWAYHLEGWNGERFQRTLDRFGYGPVEIEQSTYKAIYNVTARAIRRTLPTPAEQRAAAEELLAESLVDRSDSELALLRHWMQTFDRLSAR